MASPGSYYMRRRQASSAPSVIPQQIRSLSPLHDSALQDATAGGMKTHSSNAWKYSLDLRSTSTAVVMSGCERELLPQSPQFSGWVKWE